MDFGGKLPQFYHSSGLNSATDARRQEISFVTRASTFHHTLNDNHWLRLLEIPAIIGVKSNITTFSYVATCNLTDNLGIQQDTSPMPHQGLYIISSSYVISNWSYDPEPAKLGFGLCYLDLWHLTLTFRVDITPVNRIYYDMTVWILAGNYISFTIAAGLIKLQMPGVKKSRV